jgi:RNA methyltransferase, TrmH family
LHPPNASKAHESFIFQTACLCYTPAMLQTNPHHPITSKDNATIKHLHALSESKQRKKEQAFLIEGVKMVEEALRDNLGVKLVVASPSLVQHHGKGVLKLAENRSVEVLWISERLMDSIAESKTPQPVMAMVMMKTYSEQGLLANDASLIVMTHQLQDPGNLGTIIRTVEAVGASGVAITSNTVDPFNPKAIRASMGSILHVPIVHSEDASTFIKTCKEKGFQTVATVLTGRTTHFDIDLKKPTVMVLGQEGAGLPQDIMADIDLHVRIPMASTIDSLNVATAAAVILYEAFRQRMSQ